ncbi:unnamed protein product [Linum trigynum]|uniref:Uncharacterized protein n=1 Tax=Linum trigynum TaxID=586398 RepID=A0AAV2CU80_9ROSI
MAPIEPRDAAAALSVYSVRVSNVVTITSYLFVVISFTVTTSLVVFCYCGLSAGFDIFPAQEPLQKSADQSGFDTTERTGI